MPKHDDCRSTALSLFQCCIIDLIDDLGGAASEYSVREQLLKSVQVRCTEQQVRRAIEQLIARGVVEFGKPDGLTVTPVGRLWLQESVDVHSVAEKVIAH